MVEVFMRPALKALVLLTPWQQLGSREQVHMIGDGQPLTSEEVVCCT